MTIDTISMPGYTVSMPTDPVSPSTPSEISPLSVLTDLEEKVAELRERLETLDASRQEAIDALKDKHKEEIDDLKEKLKDAERAAAIIDDLTRAASNLLGWCATGKVDASFNTVLAVHEAELRSALRALDVHVTC